MIIKISINDRGARDVLKQLGRNSSQLRPALIKIGGMLEGASDRAFEREGPGWKRLKPATIKERGSAGPILNRSGGRGLIGSVTSQVRGNSVFIGSNLKYARVHQLGSRGKQNIPARPYLIIGKKEINEASLILERHLLKGI